MNLRNRHVSPIDILRRIFLGPFLILGIIILVGSITFLKLFVSPSVFYDIKLKGNSEQTVGVVKDIIRTQGRENKVRIYEFVYEFTEDGKTYKGKSYGKLKDLNYVELSVGGAVYIDYLKKDPNVSKIDDLSASNVPLIALILMSMMVLAGVILIVRHFLTELMILSLLARGQSASATLIDKEYTPNSILGQPVVNYVFEFVDKSGQRVQFKVSTHRNSVFSTNKKEEVLYHPSKPHKAYPLSLLSFDKG